MNKLDFVYSTGPAATSDLIPLGREVDPGAALLSPRGKVSEHGMQRFFRRFAEGVFDEEDLVRRANELADFVNAAASEYEFDVSRLTAIGYSNGANIAAALILLQSQVLNSAIFTACDDAALEGACDRAGR